MPRLIDADALPVHKAYCVDEAGWSANFYVADKSDIDNAPTIDAVPAVRCKDCKHWNKRYEVMGMCMKHNAILTFTKPDFYCAYGERRSE